MKSKKAESLAYNEVIFLIILALFCAILAVFIFSKANGASFWEDFYAKEITKVINLAEQGDEITIDVQRGTEVAFNNGITSVSEMFKIDNEKNEICVKFNNYQSSCYHYFNDVDIVSLELKLAKGRDAGNILYFRVVERQSILKEAVK